jgi:WD40 repeat protein
LRDRVHDFALTHDGKLLAVADGYALTLRDSANGKQVARSGQHRRAVTAVACSPKQPLLVSGDKTGKVFLWDTTGRVLKRYDWGLGEVYGLTFDADGLRAAAVDASGKVVVWDIDG